MKDRYSFISTFTYAEDGISISFPDLPGCLPCADNEEAALKNAKEALGLHLWSMEQDKEEIPHPTLLKDIVLKDGDAAVLISVIMPPIREKLSKKMEDLKMKKYIIDYGTGAGNREIEGTLEKAMKDAEQGLAYTQKNVEITTLDGEQVAYLPWYGVEPEEDDVVTCEFGASGFYGEWIKCRN